MFRKAGFTVVTLTILLLLLVPLFSACSPNAAPVPATTQAPSSAPAAKPAASASAAGTILWKHTSYSTQQALMEAQNQWFYSEVEKRTNGRFKVQYFWNGSLVQEDDQPDAIKARIAESTLFWPQKYPSKMPMLFASCLPFVMPQDRKQTAAIHVEFIKHPAIQAEFDRWNAVFLAGNTFSQIHFLSRVPITGLADLKGKRIEAEPGMSEMLKSFGVSHASLPSPELFDALQKGLVDATLKSAGTFNAYKLFEVAKYYVLLFMTGTTSNLVVNKQAYNALPDDIKAVFAQVSKEALTVIPEVFDNSEDMFRQAFEKTGVKTSSFPSADRARMEEVGKQLDWTKYVDQYSKQGLPAKEILDLYLKLRDKK